MIKNLFGSRDPIKKSTGYTRVEIDVAKESEKHLPEYVPLCTRIFYGKANGILKLSSDDDMSELDRLIFPHVAVGMIGGATMGGSIVCDERCPGYTPIPAEDFAIGRDYVNCKRFIPRGLVPNDTIDEWEKLRQSALEFNEIKGYEQ